MKYPRLYSLSTVGVIMHYNQDYLLHAIRTDFTGKNGIGKSLIADILQLIFIAEKEVVSFGTESLKKRSRSIHTIPYKTPDAYAFLNIEVFYILEYILKNQERGIPYGLKGYGQMNEEKVVQTLRQSKQERSIERKVKTAAN